MLYEVVHHRFGPSLRQPFVIFGRTLVVAVGRQFDGNVRILVEQHHQFVERLGRFRSERSLVEVVEDVVDEHRGRDAGQWEL